MRKTSYVPAPFAPRSTDGTTWTTAGTVAYADSTYYSDTALALATRYYYRVMATDSASTASAASNIASAVTGPTFEVSEGSSGSLLSAVVVDTEASCAACEVDPIISEDVDWGDGSSTTESGDPDSMSHYFSNPGNYTVTVIANTADGPVDSSSTTADVTVAVPTPTLEFSVPEETFSAGAAAVVYPVYCSDGAIAESEYLLDWGDGTPYQSYSNGTTEFDHCYANGEADYHVEAFLETSVGVVGADADLTITGSNPFDHPGTYSTGFSLSDTTTGSSLPATTGDTVQAFVTATMHDYSCSCGGGDDPESECGTVDFGNSSSGGFYFSNASGSEPCEAIDNSYHEDGQYLITMTASDGSDETKFATVDTTGDMVQAFVTATMHDYSCSCGGGDDPESECGTVDFGNCSSGGFYFSNASGSEPCEAIDNSYHEDGQYLITMTATDGSDETKFATVDNAVPVMSTIPEQVTGSGESFSVSDSYSNMSTELSPVAFINWGDGTGPHVATVSPSGASGTITASTSSAPAPGVYTATLTLYPMGPTGTSGGPTYAVTKTFTLYSWGVVIDHGESNDLLIASSDGTQNQQNVTLIMPHPAGEAFTVYLSGSDVSQNDLFNSSGTKLTPSGSDYPAVEIASGDSASSITYEDGAIDGNSTADVNQYTLNSEYDASDSTSAFQSQAAAGGGTVPAEAPTSNPVSQLSVIIKYVPPVVLGTGASSTPVDVTGLTQDVMVGDQTNLVAVATGPDLGHLGYHWDVAGNILYGWGPVAGTGSYRDAFAAGAPTSFTAPDLKTSKTPFEPMNAPGSGSEEVGADFFWVTTAGGANPELDDVSVTVTDKADDLVADATATTTFKVWEPSITSTSNIVSEGVAYADQSGNLGVGTSTATPPGITFSVQLNNPPWLAGVTGISTKTSLLQLVTAHTTAVAGTLKAVFFTQGELAADAGFAGFVPTLPTSMAKIWPTGTIPSTLPWDSPISNPVGLTGTTILAVDDSFQTYVMYSDMRSGSHWVPLGLTTWGYGGTEIFGESRVFTFRRGWMPVWGAHGWLYPAIPITTSFTAFSGSEPTWQALIPLGWPGSGFK